MKEKHIGGNESKGIIYSELEEYCPGKDSRALAGSIGAGSDRMVRAGEKRAQSGILRNNPGIATVTARRGVLH